jgi:glycosyltransferase EpsD
MLKGKLKAPYKALNFAECEVHYASANEEKIQNVDKSFKIDFCRNPFRLFSQFKSYRQLKKVIDAEEYDLIHTHTPTGSVITRLAARKARKNGTKVIYTCHGFQFYDGGPILDWILWYPVEKIMARFCDLIITINTEDYNLVKKHFKTDVKMINGVGVDKTKFKPKLTKKKKESLRKKLKLSSDDFIISYSAEFIARKNHRMLITALNNFLREEKHDNVHLLLMGEGVLKGRMERLVKVLGIDKNVHFLGYRNDIPDLLEISDLYISTSKNEGLGINILEASLMGCPVVMTDNRGHSEIAGAQAKYLVGVRDIDTLIDKMTLAYRGAVNYKMRFPERFSLLNSLKRMSNIYKRLLK